jgi:hypothetical protein
MNKISKILNVLNVGLGYIFQNQVGYFDKNMVKQILRDQFIQSDINNLSRGQFYSGFQNKIVLKTMKWAVCSCIFLVSRYCH